MHEGIGNVLFSTYSQTENVQDPRVSLVNLWGQVITLRGQILASRTGDDTLRVRTCVSTCARGAGILGDVLNVHTGTF